MGNAVRIIGALGGGLMMLAGMGWSVIIVVFRDIAHDSEEECPAWEASGPQNDGNDEDEPVYFTMYDIIGKGRNLLYAVGLLVMGFVVFIGALKS